MKGLGSAIRTLTILSFPGKREEDLASSLYWFPLVGALLGLGLFGVSWLWAKLGGQGWSAGAAGLMVLVEVLLTRGLHLDGLSDWADSLGSVKGSREQRLAILKDVHTGAFGVVAVVLALLLKFVIYGRLIEVDKGIWVIPALICSRTAMVELITTLPYARKEGGMGGPFVNGARPSHRVASWLSALLISLPFFPLGPVLLLATCFSCVLIRWRYLTSFGGITGDLLGTAGEVIQIGSLLLIGLLKG